jgi:hypothetical protein
MAIAYSTYLGFYGKTLKALIFYLFYYRTIERLVNKGGILFS